MVNERYIKVGLWAATLLIASPAVAEPINLEGIYRLSNYLNCNEACLAPTANAPYEEQRAYYECTAACGAPDWRWEKSGVPPVTGHQIYRSRASQPVGCLFRNAVTIPPENCRVHPKNTELAINWTIKASLAIESPNSISLTAAIADIRNVMSTAVGKNQLRLRRRL